MEHIVTTCVLRQKERDRLLLWSVKYLDALNYLNNTNESCKLFHIYDSPHLEILVALAQGFPNRFWDTTLFCFVWW